MQRPIGPDVCSALGLESSPLSETVSCTVALLLRPVIGIIRLSLSLAFLDSRFF